MLFDFFVLFVIIIIEMQMAADRRLAQFKISVYRNKPLSLSGCGGLFLFSGKIFSKGITNGKNCYCITYYG